VNSYLARINSLAIPTPKTSELPSVSVFSGGGGLDLGLSLAGFNVRYSTDKEESYCKTISTNFPKCFSHTQDIKDITSESIYNVIGETAIELLAGGSPCQSFSILGKRESFNDARGQLVFQFIRLIQELDPSVFVFENVPGILTLNKGQDWELLYSIFESTGYTLHQRVLNAADFGIPQIRRRLFVVGFREATKFQFPRSTHRSPEQDLNLLECNLPEWIPSKLAFEQIDDLLNHDVRPHGDRVRNRYDLIPPGGRDLVDHTNRIHPEKPAGTVLVGSKAGGGRPHIHPFLPRHITAREAARLQSFPDWYVLQGTQTAQYRQVGNAVPPLLGLAVGEAIRKALDSFSPTPQPLLYDRKPGLLEKKYSNVF
jgi:DNA (cytosine-5)-methyltransferase 1